MGVRYWFLFPTESELGHAPYNSLLLVPGSQFPFELPPCLFVLPLDYACYHLIWLSEDIFLFCFTSFLHIAIQESSHGRRENNYTMIQWLTSQASGLKVEPCLNRALTASHPPWVRGNCHPTFTHLPRRNLTVWAINVQEFWQRKRFEQLSENPRPRERISCSPWTQIVSEYIISP